MKEVKEVRIIRKKDNFGYCVEVYNNYESAGRSDLDDSLSCCNDNLTTIEKANDYIASLAEKYTIIRLEDDLSYSSWVTTSYDDIFMQECNSCGKRFRLKYEANGSYRYVDDPCECEDAFSPTNCSPSISQWLESLKKQ